MTVMEFDPDGAALPDGGIYGLPFTVEFHEAIAPHKRSGKIQTIVVERARARHEFIS